MIQKGDGRVNVIDEWLDSEGAKEYAEQFLENIYSMQGRRCGKTAFALYQMKKYLEKHPYATVIMPYHHGYSYVKELMNSIYWNKKPPYDDIPYDAVRYAMEELEIKQRKERLEKAKLTNEELKRMLNNSNYGVCWPSELIESCERIDKYRREEFMMELLNEGYIRAIDYDLGRDCTDVYVRVFANSMNSVKFNFYRHSSVDPIYTVKFTNPTWNEHDVCDRCREVTNHKLVWQLYVSSNKDFLDRCRKKYDALVKRNSAVPTGTIAQKEEIKDMSRNEVLNNIVGSDIYIKKDNNIMYVGRGESLDFVIQSGCELTGNISFVADDEPIEDAPRKISRSFIKKVIFNNPATIVFWRDGSKTIVKMNGKDKKFDPEKGLAMAIAKKCLGNEGNYYNAFTKFLPEEKAVKKSVKK